MDSAQVGQSGGRPRREERHSISICAAEVRALMAAQKILASCIDLGAASRQIQGPGMERTLEERRRLARELYDGVSQTLFSAGLIADVLPRIYERNPQEGRTRLEELRQLTHGALSEMRALLEKFGPAGQAATYAAAAADLDGLERWLNEVEIG